MMKEFYENDRVQPLRTLPQISAKDKQLLARIENSTKYTNHRYEVELLWVADPDLPPSYDMAIRRLEGIERKIKKNPEFGEQYKQAINSFLAKGYARMLTPAEAERTTNKTFNLPHFAVQNVNKRKIRIVFDAAAEVAGLSLNSQLLTGPDLNKPLLSVLLNFRLEPIAICGDIREMFLQVRVAEGDQDAQRFLWRHGDSTQPVRTYVMQSMLFGAKCSPTLAQFIKNKNARLFERDYPRGAAAIEECHYVDDYVDCFADEEEAIDVIKDVIMIHKHAAFELTNFASNSKQVLQALGCNNDRSAIVPLNDQNTERVLGMHWDVENDNFVFILKFNKVSTDVLEQRRRPTKREVLSIIMSIFDPFGFFPNFVVTGKLLMQELWVLGFGWDEPIPD